MNIAAMRCRITVQKNETVTDRIGNRVNSWSDFYSCWATPVQGGGSEKQEAGTINSTDSIDFTVRYAKCLEGLDSTKIRIQMGSTIYNVTAIDPMGFYHRSLKFKCEKVKR
ncbi:MAG: phage head closure protein [Candidatus Weimeria sp.]